MSVKRFKTDYIEQNRLKPPHAQTNVRYGAFSPKPYRKRLLVPGGTTFTALGFLSKLRFSHWQCNSTQRIQKTKYSPGKIKKYQPVV